MSFEDLNVREDIINTLKHLGITEPTTIQIKAIPAIREGKDVIGMSKTGSGKTAAFGIPIIERLTEEKFPQVLIMAPTRELVVQIRCELEKFDKHCRVAEVFGGVGLGPQIYAMEHAQIIVSTPGRILDHLTRGNVNLSRLKTFILDEADKMVEMGFIEDVEKIMQAMPRKKQILLFGATLSHEIERIKKQHMTDPIIAKASSQVKEEYLEQYYYNVENHEKFSLLVHLLKEEDIKRTLVFCAKRSTVEIVTKNLNKQGVKARMLHGKLSQNRRLEIIDRFKKGEVFVLVASAVAARGLDIKGLSHVYNYDLSQDPQEYIHRVGRTARAGDSGKAVTLLGPYDHDAMSGVLRNFSVNIVCLDKPKFQRLGFDAGISRTSHGQRGGYGQQRSDHGPRRNSYGQGPRRESYGQGRSDHGPRRSSQGHGGYGQGPRHSSGSSARRSPAGQGHSGDSGNRRPRENPNRIERDTART
ncbi:DEAD/DEAH box helicase [Candidatus Woesearchaeota archaeon]|nr:DEAD/DEAH box helicase [Candidatus Woesearchaeota archaeon]